MHFIKNQQCSGFVTSFAECFQKTVFRQDYSRFGLYRFHKNTGRSSGNLFQVVNMVESQKANIRQQRPVGVFHPFVAQEAEGAVGATMVSVLKPDEFRPSRKTFGQFERSLDGFAARIDKISRIEVRGQMFGQPPGQPYLRRLDVFAVNHQMHVFIQLLLYRFRYGRMPVSEIAHTNTGNQINVPLSTGSIKVNAFRFFHLYGHRFSRRNGKVLKK